MGLSPIIGLNTSEGAVLPSDYLEPRWYAAYTRANHDKGVRDQLEQNSVESFLPVYETVRRWKDRRVRMKLPLFPGYVFVHLALCDRLRVLRIPSVVRLVGYGGQPIALPDHEIEALRHGLMRETRMEPCPYLKVGHRVRVRNGPLQGLEGIFVRRKNSSRFVISLELIRRSVATEIEFANLEPVR